MSRLERLPDQAALRILRDAEQAAVDRKTSEQRVGTFNVGHHVSKSSNTYDWSGLLIPETTTYRKMFVITATAQNMEVLFARLLLYLFVGSPLQWYRPSDARNAAQSGSATYQVIQYPMPGDVNAPHVRRWGAMILGRNSSTSTPDLANDPCALKAYVVSNDDVTVTVEALA